MPSSAARGWRGIALIAIVYVYFLIFAQFAFLARVGALGIAGESLKIVMAAMAAGGILLSLLVPRIRILGSPALRLRIGLGVSAVAALLTLAPLSLGTAAAVAFLIGAGLGISTVTLVTHLDQWIGRDRGIFKASVGTGLAYVVCNVPAVFTAGPEAQALLAASLCFAGIALPLGTSFVEEASEGASGGRISFVVALLAFTALIWLDSAAFFIIQHTPLLKAGTWMGSVHLWTNAALHLSGAVLAGALLQRGRASGTLALAFGALGFACLLLQSPGLALSASLFYPLGVSLYSVALVAYPAFLARANTRRERGQQAGVIYAVAGWIGSALGIGMGQNLGHVPGWFVGVAGVAVMTPILISVGRSRTREMAMVGVGALAALLLYRVLPRPSAPDLNTVKRGRRVYISEGCISCHSQYVRPHSPDVLIWGPVESTAAVHAERPPLIGNRRQGPDLAEVGARRSALWLKAHLMHPAELSYHSPMPSYAFLFHDGRGPDLVAYLASLHGPGVAQQRALEAAWQPAESAWGAATLQEGQKVYEHHCATCHDANGATRNTWKNDWKKIPQDASSLHAMAQATSRRELAKISKFGIAGSDMPGFEYLSDRQIASAVLWLKQLPTISQNLNP